MLSIDLSERVVWITGGSRGLGRSIAQTMYDAGASVAISYLAKEQEAMKFAEGKDPNRVLIVQTDVNDEKSCEQAVKQVEARFGGIHILVNSAGIVRDQLFLMQTTEDWKDVLQTNLYGAVHCIRAVVRLMMMKRFGRIINLGSISGVRGGRGQAPYGASKAALHNLTQSLAVELSGKNILVNAIAPGVIETDMTVGIRQLASAKILDHQLIKRHGKPEDVSGLAAFLASDFANFITGQTFVVDGGYTLG